MKIFKRFLCLEISLTVLTSVIATKNIGKCINHRTQVSCCSNYHEVNNTCVECPTGMFGMNCSKHCPNGSYGALCRSKCNCKSSEICDAQIGCKGTLHSSEIKTQVVTDFTDSHENTPSLPLLSPVFYLSLTISLASIVICVLIGTTIYFAKRSKKGGWSVYACPLPSNSVTMQEPQQEDYTVILTNRAQQAY